MISRHRKTFRMGLALFLLWCYSPQVQAQCAMCRAVLESSDDTSMAEGINNGIVYLMAVPYILVGVLIFIVYRKMRAD